MFCFFPLPAFSDEQSQKISACWELFENDWKLPECIAWWNLWNWACVILQWNWMLQLLPPPKLNSSPLEKGGTGTGRRSFPIRKAPFQGRTVKLRGGISIFMAASPKFFGPEMMDCRSLPWSSFLLTITKYYFYEICADIPLSKVNTKLCHKWGSICAPC